MINHTFKVLALEGLLMFAFSKAKAENPVCSAFIKEGLSRKVF